MEKPVAPKKAAAKPAARKTAARVVAKPAASAAPEVAAPAKAAVAPKAKAAAAPRSKTAAAPKAKASAATKVKAAPVTKAPAAPKVKVHKPKLVRDSFTMPDDEYAVLGLVKKACLKAGVEVKKSELLRAGVALLKQLDLAGLRQVLSGLPQLKTGRPKKS